MERQPHLPSSPSNYRGDDQDDFQQNRNTQTSLIDEEGGETDLLTTREALNRRIQNLQELVATTQIAVKHVNEELLVRQDEVLKLQRKVLDTGLEDASLLYEYKSVMRSYDELKQANTELLKNHEKLIAQYNQVIELYNTSFQQITDNKKPAGKVLADRVVCGNGKEMAITEVNGGGQKIMVTCSVCYEEMDKAEEGSTFVDCMHWYHFPCISAWLTKNNSCPVCYAQVTEIFKLKAPTKYEEREIAPVSIKGSESDDESKPRPKRTHEEWVEYYRKKYGFDQ